METETMDLSVPERRYVIDSSWRRLNSGTASEGIGWREDSEVRIFESRCRFTRAAGHVVYWEFVLEGIYTPGGIIQHPKFGASK
jgi:hypothetical protein